ncbi:hypothetical protein RB595_006463 [Gaeumannomyces hyphopodioides]
MELARQEFLRAYQWNSSLRSLRPIAADIGGTEQERRFFHSFRAAISCPTDSAHPCVLAGGHVSDYGTVYFWSTIAPRLAHREGAIKHALIALGSAYQLYQQSPGTNWRQGGEAVGPGGAGTAAAAGVESSGELELFTIQQYNKSIALLARHACPSSPESIQVTLICCLSFICLEMLRADHAAALTHLTNGLRILESLVPEAFDFLANDTDLSGSTPPSRRPSPSPPSPQPQQQQQPPTPSSHQQHHATSRDMREIIRIFCRLECSAALFASGVQPSLALRAYARRRLDDGSLAFPPGTRDAFESLSEAHAHISSHLRDVVARMSETNGRWADHSFWSDPYQHEQQAALRRRSSRLASLLNHFAAGPAGPAPATPEYMSLHLDLLQVLTANVFIDGMTGLEDQDDAIVDDFGRLLMSDVALNGGFDLGSSPPREMWELDPALMSGELLGGSDATAGGRRNSGSGGVGHRSQASLAQMVEVASGIVQTGSMIKQQGGASNPSGRWFIYDSGVLWPVYLAATSAQDPAVRQKALKILREATTREGLWDGPALHELIREVGSKVAQSQWPFHEVPRSLTGLGGIPDMWQTLTMMRSRDMSG